MTDLNLLDADTQTMSSLEIAKLTGKRHTDVCDDIKRILQEVELQGATFSVPCKMPSGQTAYVFNLQRMNSNA